MPEISSQIADARFKLHHIGIAVSDLQQALDFYSSALGLQKISALIEDPVQKVRVCFLAGIERAGARIELICPLDNDSPINGYLKKGIGAYHLCYEVEEIGNTLKDLRNRGCLIISGPVPAVAFEGRKIAWCYTPTQHLLELLEERKS